VNVRRIDGLVVGVASALAVASSLGMLLVEPGSRAWTLAATAAALSCLLHGGRLTWGRVEPTERFTWRAFGGAALVVAFGLLAGAWTSVVARSGIGDTVWEDTWFGIAAVVFCSFAYHGLIHWNQFRADDNDLGDWLNGACAVLVTVAAAALLLRAADAPMSHWDNAAMEIWIAHVVALVVLVGTVVTVGVLGGRARDPRFHVLTVALGAAAVAELSLGLAGERLTGQGAQVVWVILITVFSACSLVPAAAVRPPTSRSQSPVLGALGVLGLSVVVLVLNTTLGGDKTTTTGLAAATALGGGLRLLQLVAAQAELARSQEEARTDELTGLANRRALRTALGAVSDGEGDAALMIVDLDRFKEVNDHYGHAVGDEVLTVVGLRLRSILPSNALLSRLGGDEFAVLLPGGTLAQATVLSEQLVGACSQRVPTSSGPVTLGASIGIATTELGAQREGELLRRADTALYAAKRAGGGTRTYDSEADRKARTDRERLEDLRILLRPESAEQCHEQIEVHFQPQVDAGSGAVVGAEALVRWQHPHHGLLPPVSFLDLAERHGLMSDLTAVVLRLACAEAVRWQRLGHPLRLSINLSTSSLGHPDLLSTLDQVLAESGLASGRLVLEITETTLMARPERALEVTRAIAERGIGISIDDFGTGYSSLAYLHDLPVTELKLDRSFVSRLTQEHRTVRIVASTIDLGHGLGLRIVGEGVEDEQTLRALVDLGCDETQGYLHGRPMPAEQFVSWLAGIDPVRLPTVLIG
jgi:diguanylate cyclase (GGDEF)-like protein